MVPIKAPIKNENMQNHSSCKTAMNIRKKYAVRTLSGKRLTELKKEGK